MGNPGHLDDLQNVGAKVGHQHYRRTGTLDKRHRQEKEEEEEEEEEEDDEEEDILRISSRDAAVKSDQY